MEKLKAKIDKIIGFKLQFNAPAYYLNKLFKEILNWVDNKITKLESNIKNLQNKINNINLSAENISYENENYSSVNNVKETLDFILDNVDDCLNIQSDWDETNETSPAYIKNKPNGILTLKAGNNTKTFSVNQKDNIDFEIPISQKDTLGLIKTSSDITDPTKYTPCPIVDGVPYYSPNIQILTDNDFSFINNEFYTININDNAYFIYNGESKIYIYNEDLTKIQICIPNVIYFYKDNKLNRLGELLDYVKYLSAYSKGVLDCLYKLTYTSNSGQILNTIKNIEALKNGDVINYIVKCSISNSETLTIPSEVNATIDIEVNREKTINLVNLCDTSALIVKSNDEIFIEFLYLDNYLYITKILKYNYGN